MGSNDPDRMVLIIIFDNLPPDQHPFPPTASHPQPLLKLEKIGLFGIVLLQNGINLVKIIRVSVLPPFLTPERIHFVSRISQHLAPPGAEIGFAGRKIDLPVGFPRSVKGKPHPLFVCRESPESPVLLNRPFYFMGQFCKLRSRISAFLQVKVHPVINGPDDHLFTAPAGKKDERKITMTRSDLDKELNSVHARHLVIR